MNICTGSSLAKAQYRQSARMNGLTGTQANGFHNADSGNPCILGSAVAFPEHSYTQEEVLEAVSRHNNFTPGECTVRPAVSHLHRAPVVRPY